MSKKKNTEIHKLYCLSQLLLENQPSIMQRSSVGEIILSKFMNFVNTFFNE